MEDTWDMYEALAIVNGPTKSLRARLAEKVRDADLEDGRLNQSRAHETIAATDRILQIARAPHSEGLRAAWRAFLDARAAWYDAMASDNRTRYAQPYPWPPQSAEVRELGIATAVALRTARATR